MRAFRSQATENQKEAVRSMEFFKTWGAFMVEGSRAFARWEVENARVILGDRKRIWLLALLLLPGYFRQGADP